MIKAPLLPVIIFLLPFGAGATTLRAWSHNREGVRHLGNKAYYQANQEFMKALEDDPLNPEVQLNLGLTFEAAEDFEKAEQAYRGVLAIVPESSPLRFEALFNLAGAYAKDKKIEAALDAYQQCLEINPDSLEVKTNIELLWKGGGGGGGGGKQKDQKQDKKDDKDNRSNQQKREDSLKNPPPEEPKNKQPKPFESPDLSKEDVKRILDEIKNQEQSIRANEYEKGAKEAPRGKDW